MARQESGIRRTKGEKALETVILILLIITSAAMLFPFLNLLAKSLSGESAVLRGDIVIFPKDFQIGTYQYVMRQSMFFTALKCEGNKWDSSNRPCYRSRIYESTDAFHLQKTMFTHRKNAFFRPEIIHLNTGYRGVIVLHVIAKYQLSQ